MPELPFMPLSSGPCFSRVSRHMPVLISVSILLFKLYYPNTLVPTSPNQPLHMRTLRLPLRMQASFTAGASAIPSGHSCSAIFRHRWPSGADTVRDNFGRATTSDTSGAECCRLSGGRPPSAGSGHTLLTTQIYGTALCSVPSSPFLRQTVDVCILLSSDQSQSRL